MSLQNRILICLSCTKSRNFPTEKSSKLHSRRGYRFCDLLVTSCKLPSHELSGSLPTACADRCRLKVSTPRAQQQLGRLRILHIIRSASVLTNWSLWLTSNPKYQWPLQMIIFNRLSSLVHMNQNWIWSHSLYHSRPSPTPNSCPPLFLDEHPSAGPWTAFHHVHMITEEHSSLLSLWDTLSTPSKVCEKRDKSAQANRMQITQTSNLKNYITKSRHSTVHYYHVFVPWREFASSYLSMRIQRKIQNKTFKVAFVSVWRGRKHY